MLATESSGVLWIDEAAIRQLDLVSPAFFVCAALAYLEFEEDAAVREAACC